MNPGARTVLDGGRAGAVATAAMSVPMLVAGRRGAMGTQPPERVAETALDGAGAGHSREKEQNLAASLAHLAFGAGGGVVFALARRRLDVPVPTVVQGVAYGLAVWAVSYKGWLPALNILPPAQHDRPDRRRTMIFAHVVYGATLGGLDDHWSGRG